MDAVHDLLRSEDQPVLREAVDHQLAAARPVVSGDHPCGEVRLRLRGVGDHQDQLGLGLPRKPHHRVVGLHRAAALFTGHRGDLPLVLAVVDVLGLVHVIDGEHPRLSVEEVLRVAQVPPQVLGHRAQILEEAGEDPLPGVHQRVVRIGDVEGDRSIVGVDRDLHRVADVVGALAARLRVGVAPALGVGVLDPGERAVVAHDHVGVAVVGQEGRQRTHTVANVPVQEDVGLVVDVVREEDLEGPLGHRER